MSSNNKRAFTLIEVMAAVFMLGLFVTAISQLLTQARLNEGHARLQAQAAALADLQIAKLEEGLARGAALPLGKTDSADFPWTVTTEVVAFDGSSLLPSPAPDEDPRARPSAVPGASGSWLRAQNAQQEPPVLEIEVRVSWDGAPVDAETGEPDAIRRRTFALNPAALESLAKLDTDGDGEDQEAE